MCTYVLHFDPKADWPLVLAGNRDEVRSRSWAAPAEHWDDRPGVVAGLDQVAGGSWCGINQAGVVCAILNRWDTLGQVAGKRSRGELVLDALDHTEAIEAAEALGQLEPESYRGFNLLIADNSGAFWLRHGEDSRGIECQELSVGTHLISHGEMDDLGQPRGATFLPQFQAAGPPANPESVEDWQAWRQLFGTQGQSDPREGLFVDVPQMNFGTGSQSFIALRSPQKTYEAKSPGVYWFAKPGEPLSQVL